MTKAKGLLVGLILGVALLAGSPVWTADFSIQKAEELNKEVTKFYEQGRYAEALPVAEKIRNICEKSLGPEHPETALALNNLAALYFAMRAYDKAEPLYKRTLVINEKALGPEHPHTASALNNLAELYYKMGAYAKSEPLYKKSLTQHFF